MPGSGQVLSGSWVDTSRCDQYLRPSAAPVKGLEFALFTVLTLDAFRSREELPSLLLAGASVTVVLVLTARPAVWMPVGILAIPAVTALHGSVTTDPHGAWYAPLAVAVTIGVHLACGRRTILGVGAGTAFYAVMPNTL